VVRVAAAAKGPVVVLLNVGSPKELSWIDKVPGILVAYYGGEESAAAVVETILGRSCPSGRLPTTWPRKLEDLPSSNEKARLAVSNAATAGDVPYVEGLAIGYRALTGNAEARPLFSFGHGLSYTSFAYTGFRAQILSSSSSAVAATACVTVKNDGSRAGAEVAQLYVHGTAPGGAEQRSLRGFKRTRELQPGEEQQLVFELDSRALGSYFDVEAGRWVPPPPGCAKLEIGASATDVRGTTTLNISSPPPR